MTSCINIIPILIRKLEELLCLNAQRRLADISIIRSEWKSSGNKGLNDKKPN